jgi:cyclohexadieny/prephenate dehydrogenase
MDDNLDNEQNLNDVGVVGLGLLGGSIALGLKEALPEIRLLGFDQSEATRGLVRAAEIFDYVGEVEDLFASEVLPSLRLLVLAIPVLSINELIKRLMSWEQDAGLLGDMAVTDVGSTKNQACLTAWAYPGGGRFVGSHPMAGKERSGWSFAQKDLYKGATIFVTPHGDAKEDDPYVNRVVGMWRTLGGKVSLVSPQDHDDIVAFTSHLPHSLSMSLMSYLGERPTLTEPLFEKQKRWFGGGLVDFTRIAASSPEMWSEIFIQNKGALLSSLLGFQKELDEMIDRVRRGDKEEWLRYLRHTKALRDRIVPPANPKGSGEEEAGDISSANE